MSNVNKVKDILNIIANPDKIKRLQEQNIIAMGEILRLISSLLRKYRNKSNELNNLKRQMRSPKEKIIESIKVPSFLEGKYNNKMDGRTNMKINLPDIKEFSILLDVIKNIVDNNWYLPKLEKRLTHSTKPYVLEGAGKVSYDNPDSKQYIIIPDLLKIDDPNKNFFIEDKGEGKIGRIKNFDKFPGVPEKIEIIHIDSTKLDEKNYTVNSRNQELKRFLNDIATDFNVIHFSSDYVQRIFFISIWLEVYRVFFEQIYKKNPKLDANNLNIMFKGGVTLRALLLTSYIDFNNIEETNIFEKIKNIIKIGDFDFEIISDSKVCDWKLINKINILSYVVMCEVVQYFELNKEFFFRYFKYSKSMKQKLGNKLLKDIKDAVKIKRKKYDERKKKQKPKEKRSINMLIIMH